MKFCLDTDTAIEVLRGERPHFRRHFETAAAGGGAFHLSSIVFHELMFGAMASGRPEHHMAQVELLARRMQLESWTAEDAMEAARIRAELRKHGTALGGLDALIAGQAMRCGWTVVTANLRDFMRVPGLVIQDWSNPEKAVDLKGGDPGAWAPGKR